MEKIEEVKKILSRYLEEGDDFDTTTDAEEICEIKDAECQKRVERIFRKIERYASYAPEGDIIEILLGGDWWQALKKQEGME